MSNHPPERITPLPWEACGVVGWPSTYGAPFWCNIVSKTVDGRSKVTTRVLEIERSTKEAVEADANYIVHACNNYPKLEALNMELAEALEKAMGALQYIAQKYPKDVTVLDQANAGVKAWELANHVLRQLTEIVGPEHFQKAKGGV